MRQVSCSGAEFRLLDCPDRRDKPIKLCNIDYKESGVVCSLGKGSTLAMVHTNLTMCFFSLHNYIYLCILQLRVLMERCVWWRESQSGRGDWRCVSVRGGALSVVMDGLTPTPTSSAMTSDMTSVVRMFIIHLNNK